MDGERKLTVDFLIEDLEQAKALLKVSGDAEGVPAGVRGARADAAVLAARGPALLVEL